MKKTATILALLAFAGSAFAAEKASVHDQVTGQGYGMAGCGLGSILFGKKPGLIQVVAATFNGTSGNQTFAISSGTSNCVPGGSGPGAQIFIEANKEALAMDAARGQGETIDNLAKLMNCSNTNAFGAKLQSNYQTIFPAAGTESGAVTRTIFDVTRAECNVQG